MLDLTSFINLYTIYKGSLPYKDMLNFHICDFFTKMLDLLSFKYTFSGRDLYKSKNYVRNSQNVMIYILNSGF